MRKLMILVLVVALSGGWLAAASLAGKWSVTANTSYGQSYYLTLNLTEANGKLSGKMTTPDGGEVELQNLKQEGDQLTFEVWIAGSGYSVKAKATGADAMTGTWEGGGDNGTVAAKRAD
jgi:hypothetical protein